MRKLSDFLGVSNTIYIIRFTKIFLPKKGHHFWTRLKICQESRVKYIGSFPTIGLIYSYSGLRDAKKNTKSIEYDKAIAFFGHLYLLHSDRTLLRERQHNILRTYCLLYTSPSPRDRQKSRMPSSA